MLAVFWCLIFLVLVFLIVRQIVNIYLHFTFESSNDYDNEVGIWVDFGCL